MPLTKRIYNDYYFEELQNNDFKVEYLDITAIFYPHLEAEHFDYQNTIYVENYVSFEDYLKKQDIKNTLFISILTYIGLFLKVYLLLKKYKCISAVFARDNVPEPDLPFFKLKALTLKRLILFSQSIFAYLFKKTGLVKPYDYIFTAGTVGYLTIGKGAEIDLRKAKEIKMNSIDYGYYLASRGSKSLIDGEYCLFLDQYIPYHNDFKMFGKKTVNAERYYDYLNRFFDRIEEMLNIPVVIAPHPKALKYQEKNFFNGRKVIFDKTNKLIEHSSLVMAHDSTAVFFAVMYKKKTIFLIYDEYKKLIPSGYEKMKLFSEMMDGSIVAIDKDVPINLPRNTIEDTKRNNILYKYLTSKETENKQSSDIFIEFLKQENFDV
jgi:hypothetical protein